MRFVVKYSGCNGERVGNLTGLVKSVNIETPTSALMTQGGSVVHITAEVLAKIFSTPQLLWVPLSNSYHLEPGAKAQGEGIAKFSGLPQHITCTALHSVSDLTPLGHFELDKVPLWAKHGKKMLSANRYMDLMEVFKPEMILAIADDKTSLADGLKRIKKSVDRTTNMLNVCVERYKASNQLQKSSMIGVIVGGADSKKTTECIQNVLKHKDTLRGVALGGITDASEESMKVPTETLEGIFGNVGDAIPGDMVRMVEGSWNPAVVVAAIQHGWDVFDGSYPLQLTNAGLALALSFDVTHNIENNCILDLKCDRYKDDFTPILNGCECLTCRKHTRAYIRHLLNTREMLSSVLLSIHNLYHFDQMFYHARSHIASNTFSVFKKHITNQYEMYKASDIDRDKRKNVEENGVKEEKSVKKIRTNDEILANTESV